MGNAYAVIMAGGVGKRFWPASRRSRPKQLLALGPSEKSLLRATVDRIGSLIPAERTIVVTSASLLDAVTAELDTVPKENFLAEPVGRNTAPCVGWAAHSVLRRDPEAVLAVLPADHYISDAAAFTDVLERSLAAAAAGDLVTVGIQPTRAETGYGYLELGDDMGSNGDVGSNDEGGTQMNGEARRVHRFVEKPEKARAEQFVASGRYLWNSGMFFFRADVIRDAIQTHLPSLGQELEQYDRAAASNQETSRVQETYQTLPDISIDHGVMEKERRVAVVEGSFGWSDLGSWTSSWELSSQNADGNAVPADAVTIDTRGCMVRAPNGKRVALVGVRDLVIVDTADALLVVPRDRAQQVKDVVAEFEERSDSDIL